jgi:ubiquinone/menaquinone biosynthesis C-methylase UbiE
MHERRFHGDPARLRSERRRELLALDLVVTRCLEDGACSVLDVGTGSALFAEAFAARGLRAAGIDASLEMVRSAAAFAPRAAFCVATAEALPLRAGGFDLVFLGHLLHETDAPIDALREARRVARLSVAVLEWPYRAEEDGPPLAHRLRPEAIEALAREAGFAGIAPEPHPHMTFYRLRAQTGGGD